jgi:hypothetical protein
MENGGETFSKSIKDSQSRGGEGGRPIPGATEASKFFFNVVLVVG